MQSRASFLSPLPLLASVALGALGVLGAGCASDQADRNADYQGGYATNASVRNVVRAHLGEVSACYDRRLLARPTLQGRIEIQFTISRAGHVTNAGITSNTLHDEPTEYCILSALRSWQFPRSSGGVVLATYPFVLRR